MSRLVAGIVAVMAGFAVMGLELTAVRVLAPHFGDSAYVWTNVIGVMLLALAAGAWLGGRLADSAAGARRLSSLFLAAGLLCAAVPLVSGGLGSWLLPQDLQLDSAMAAMVRGSLVATLVLFAPPVTLVGCMTPMLVTALVQGGVRVGAASGLVAASATVGSLLGTFATTHLLVPGLGSRATIWVCAALILACGALLRPSLRATAALAVPLLLLPWSWDSMRGVPVGTELLAEVESRYQFLQVVREDGERSTVKLKINEGLDSFHSIAIDGTAYSGGRYYDYHAMVPYLVGDGVTPAPLRVLSLGAAAGTFARVFAAAHPASVVDGVEIDPAVVELGAQHFGGRPDGGTIHAGIDARVFVESAPGPYEVVLVDAYERQIYVPAHVASREFFSAIRGCLRPGGVVSVNAGGRTFDDPVVQAVSRTMADVFGETHAFRVPRSRNFVLVARKDQPLDPSVLQEVEHDHPEMRQVLGDASSAGAWRRLIADGPVLTDDRPLLDVLQERALEQRMGFAGLTPIQGSVDPEQAAARATVQIQRDRDYEGALDTVRTARAATPDLRVLAAGARWLLRDLAGAEMEYQAALGLRPGASLRLFAEQNLTSVREELEGIAVASGAARRNGWLAAAVGVLFLGALGFAGARVR